MNIKKNLKQTDQHRFQSCLYSCFASYSSFFLLYFFNLKNKDGGYFNIITLEYHNTYITFQHTESRKKKQIKTSRTVQNYRYHRLLKYLFLFLQTCSKHIFQWLLVLISLCSLSSPYQTILNNLEKIWR